ncbi:MAG: CHRD domain-containing protein, partial [Caulobacteraceae bacterium]
TITGLDLGGQTAATADNVTASHFHLGAPGTNGGVVFGFIGTPNNDTDGDTLVTAATGVVKGQWDAGEGNGTTLTAQVNNLLAGQLYFNMHTTANPGGEIRGQVLAQDAGHDRIDMRGTGVADFAALQALTTDVGGSAQINVVSGGQTYTLSLQGVAKASLTAADFIFGAPSGGGVPPAVLTSFSNIHLGRAPTTAEQTALLTASALATAAQNKAIVDTADVDTAVAMQSYQYFTGLTPSQAGSAFLTNSATNANDLNDPYYAQFNIENRYINFAANLGIFGEGAAAFQATFGALTFAQSVSLAYGRIIGFNYAATAGINATAAVADITGRLAYFQGVAHDGLPANVQDIGTKAAMIGYILAEGIKADVGAYATASNAFMADLLDGSAQFNVNLIGVYAPIAPTGAPVQGGGPIVTDPMPVDPYGYGY